LRWTTKRGQPSEGGPHAPTGTSLDGSPGPLQEFAADLRRLREEAGNPPYRKLAESAHFSKATLAAAASGYRLPTWEVTRAYVQACGGNVEEWYQRWQRTREELGLPAATPPEQTPTQQPTATPQVARRRRMVLIASGLSLTLLVCLVVVVWLTSSRTASPTTSTGAVSTTETPARFAGRKEPIVDNADPKRTGCAADPAGVATLDSVEINTQAEEFLGVAELRHSPTCRVAWGRFTPSDRLTFMRADATITITARRPSTGTFGKPYSVHFDGQAAFGNILLEQSGCVEITVTIDSPTGGGSATTACKP
jgi:hypothetical protein